MKRVFMSASFPTGERGLQVAPFYPADIASAAAAVAEGTLRSGAMLTFGGHPTISPIVLQIASLLGAGDRVVIYHSDYFADQVTAEVRRLVDVERATLRFAPSGTTREESLLAMRQLMLGDSLQAAFFVGGMSGIVDEYRLLQELQPSTPRFLFATPGGMAARIVDQLDVVRTDTGLIGKVWPSSDPSASVLAGRAYASLVVRALEQER